jgi:hypothetical protein
MLLIRFVVSQSFTQAKVRCKVLKHWSRGMSWFESGRTGDCVALSRKCSSRALEGDDGKRSAEGSNRRKRHRHRFQVDSIPSFQDFQQQKRTRGLYRQFLRLVWHTSQRSDFLSQIRHEFRNVAVGDDWQRKRAFSEGGRRLKELSAMLGTSVAARNSSREGGDGVDDHSSRDASTRAPPSTSELWPWQRQEEALPHGPVAYPPKTK